MMPRRTKIESTKSFTFEILITSNTRVLAKLVGVAFQHAHIRKKEYENLFKAIYIILYKARLFLLCIRPVHRSTIVLVLTRSKWIVSRLNVDCSEDRP